ncbi:MAG: fibronectin type III domain-containing protein [Pseudomonadota bacterium]
MRIRAALLIGLVVLGAAGCGKNTGTDGQEYNGLLHDPEVAPHPEVAPDAPTGLAAETIDSAQIRISWTNNADNAESISVERKTTGDYAEITSVTAEKVSYVDSGLSSKTQYFYRVRAVNGAGNSDYSNEADATTQLGPRDAPDAPANLTLTPAGGPETAYVLSMKLAWTEASTNVDHFSVERSFSGAAGSFVVIGTPTATSYEDRGLLNPCTMYFYRVKAVSTGSVSSAYVAANQATNDYGPPPAPWIPFPDGFDIPFHGHPSSATATWAPPPSFPSPPGYLSYKVYISRSGSFLDYDCQSDTRTTTLTSESVEIPVDCTTTVWVSAIQCAHEGDKAFVGSIANY